MSAESERLGAALRRVPCESHRFAFWTEQLRQGGFKYGFGVLRDAEDAYDPMGVLAEINEADWGYDEIEEAYTISGAAMHLPPAAFRSFLGIQQHVSDAAIVELTTLLGALADSLDSHSRFASALAEARTAQERRLHRLSETLDRVRPTYMGPGASLGDRYGSRYNYEDVVGDIRPYATRLVRR